MRKFTSFGSNVYGKAKQLGISQTELASLVSKISGLNSDYSHLYKIYTGQIKTSKAIPALCTILELPHPSPDDLKHQDNV